MTAGRFPQLNERKLWIGLFCRCGCQTGALGRASMPGDQLVGHVVEIIADNMRLRADAQDIVAYPLD